jgi:hypothetical protein
MKIGSENMISNNFSEQSANNQFINKENNDNDSNYSTEKDMVTIGYATDIEGNYDYWERYISLSKILSRSVEGVLLLNEDCHFVFGGDVVDRGFGDLRVLADLIGLKRNYFDRVHFIMGNRDINKMRIPVELSAYMLGLSPRVYWLKGDERDNTEGDTAVDRLKWILTKTMGSPLAFEYRKEELRLIGGGAEDEDVVRSFIDLLKPNGLMTEYLRYAKIAIIIGDTLILHGALHTYNMGWLPPMKEKESENKEHSKDHSDDAKEHSNDTKEHFKEQKDDFKEPLEVSVDKEHSTERTFSKELSVITAASDVLCQLRNSDDDDDDDDDNDDKNDDDSDSDIDDGYEHTEGKRC